MLVDTVTDLHIRWNDELLYALGIRSLCRLADLLLKSV